MIYDDLAQVVPFSETWPIIDMSKIQDFQACPRKYFYRHILGWDSEEPSIHLHFGSCWHLALAHLYANDFSTGSVARAGELFLEAYDKSPPPNYTKKQPAAALEALFRYAAHYADDLIKYEVLSVETPYRIPISSGRHVTVNRDLVVRHKLTGELAIIEHKTATSLGVTYDKQWSLSPQICMYAFSGYMEFPDQGAAPSVLVNATSFLAKSFEFRRVQVLKSFSGIQNALYSVNCAWDSLEENIQQLSSCHRDDEIMCAFPQRPAACSNFSGCPYFDFCTCCGNPLSLASPPLGFTIRFWNPDLAYLNQE